MIKQPYTLTDIDFYREGDQCKVTFLNPDQQACQLLVGNSPEEISQLLAETTSNTFTFKLKKEQGPYYYRITGTVSNPMFSERLLPLTGAINVRDMGGYRTEAGQQVRWGLLYRGDQLSQLTEADIAYLERINFRSIIDFRNDQERELNPNYSFTSIKNYYQCDPNSTVSEAAGAVVSFEEENKLIVKNLENGAVPQEELNGSGIIFHKNYREFVTSDQAKESFRGMLKALLQEENLPTFMHCRGGKDRTGFGAALILAIIGVEREEIIKDYLITQDVREERTKFKMAQYAKYTDNQDVLDYLEAMIDTRRDYLESSFAAIDETYDSVEDYVKTALGITSEEIQTLKKLYLTA